jgi:hypothetical protein
VIINNINCSVNDIDGSVNEIDGSTFWEASGLMFSGDNMAITILWKNGAFWTYNRLKGNLIHADQLTPPSLFPIGAHWVHEESLRFATCFNNNEKYVVNIQEFQPASAPLLPLSLIKQFFVPLYSGGFPSPQFPSMHHLSLRQRLLSLMFKTQESYYTSKPVPSSLDQDAFLLMGAFLHATHQDMRFAFGKTHPLVTSPGAIPRPSQNSMASPSHP